MVATVGSISIDLSTNTVKFSEGFKKAATTVDRETGRMTKSLGSLGNAARGVGGMMQGFVGGLAAGAVTAGLGALSGALGKARQALSDFEEIGIRAKASGLGTDFFQGLSFGAGQVDVEMETLNKSLEVFAKNVGLARDGSGALYSGLLKINPELLKAVLTAGDQEQRLKLVADAMRGMTDETQKAALAATVFGKGGLDMIRVLDGGAAALDKFTATAREMGIIIPPDLIERAGELDDKMKVLSDVINANFSMALVNLAPVLFAGSQQLVQFSKDVNQLSKDITAFASNPGLSTFDKLFNVTIREGSIADRIRDFITGAGTAAEKTGRLNTELLAAQKHLADLIAMGAGFEDFVQPAIDNVARLKREIIGLGATVRDMDLAQQRRLLENAGAPAWTSGGGKPTVTPGLKAEVPDDVMDKVEAAIHGGTDETERVGRYVQDLDRNMGGYIGDLSNAVTYNFENLNEAVEVLGHRVVEMAKINESFRFDAGLGGSTGTSGSRAGRRYTIDAPGITIPLGGMPFAAQGNEQTIAETGGAGGGGAVNVNVVVKPVMEGTRVSSQSLAELKQAAAAGTEAALRAYHGR